MLGTWQIWTDTDNHPIHLSATFGNVEEDGRRCRDELIDKSFEMRVMRLRVPPGHRFHVECVTNCEFQCDFSSPMKPFETLNESRRVDRAAVENAIRALEPVNGIQNRNSATPLHGKRSGVHDESAPRRALDLISDEKTRNENESSLFEDVQINMSRGRNWIFTINNHDNDIIDRLKGLEGVCVHMVMGEEVAPTTGTRHLQGFVQFRIPKRQNQVKRMLGGSPHVELCRDVEASIGHCMKDGDCMETGKRKLVKSQGKRSELELFKEAAKNGNHDSRKLREDHAKVAAMHPQFLRQFALDQIPNEEVETFELRQWQLDLKTKLDGEPDTRTMFFIVDETGNVGKTWFAHWCRLNGAENERIQVMIPGKKADMAHALVENPRVVFFLLSKVETR